MTTQPHLVTVIQTAKISFQYGPEKPIQLGTTATKYINVKSDITDRIEKFDLLIECLIENYSLTAEDRQTIEQFKETAKRDILYSAISTDFLSKHDEIRHETTYDTLFAFITNAIGTETDKTLEAHQQLKDVTENERWTRFYDRIKRYTNDVSTSSYFFSIFIFLVIVIFLLYFQLFF